MFIFITPQAARAILTIFMRELFGPYITWPEYVGRNVISNSHACSEENVKAAFEEYVERRFPYWMSSIWNIIFAKHKSVAFVMSIVLRV